jgi:hypothetical protein
VCVDFNCQRDCGVSGRRCCAGFICDFGLRCSDGTCR